MSMVGGRRVALVALLAAVVGGAVGALGMSFLPHGPSAADLRLAWTEDDLELARGLDALRARLDATDGRVTALESAGPQQDPLDDLIELRDAVRREFEATEAQLDELRTAVLEFAASYAALPLPAAETVLDEEQRALWAARSRSDDAGERFSALCFLGTERSDVGVAVCLERLADEDETSQVLWKALHNLGHFVERSAAVDVARFLDADEIVLRGAAFRALRRMGAPESGYDPAVAVEKRTQPTADLREWARGQR